ncbi:sugar phosphate permease [Leucobacter komagatae]|uniref:Sugar phosphate permease n=1 Tax=Leucobacter komagatae TaxID=55969 RepID=A0A542Y2K4_9MICO|nr:MFS transporter [Leucobacter komagatae]TQL42263.1 sugar phosphate permease [Leucobacter komagatae]
MRPGSAAPAIAPRSWAMLAVMVFGQASTTVVTATPAFLIPYLHADQGMSLASAGMLAGAPHLGLVLTLIAWGALTDRVGERRVLLVGLSLTTLAVVASMAAQGFVWLGVALVASGAMSACINNASGRLITGWFPAEKRGLAMGIRQTCQPVGMAIAALAVPALANAFGIVGALAFGGALTLISLLACAVIVVDPMIPAKALAQASSNPYRESSALARIHAVSVLLVIPQFVLSSFGLVWFVIGFGWSELAAGALVAGAQLIGAAGRIAAGVWSDRASSRLRPIRLIALACAALLVISAAFGWADWAIPAAVAYVLVSCVSVADNGLAFTAVAEIAGPRWSGRALGAQNTGQFLASGLLPPLIGAMIASLGMPATLALVALAPLLAAPVLPSEELAHATAKRTVKAVR